MAVRIIIGNYGPGNIIKLDVVRFTYHQDIVPFRQQTVLQNLRHLKRHFALRGTVGKRHSAGNRNRRSRSGAGGSASHLGRSVRMAQRLDAASSLCPVARIDADRLILSGSGGTLVQNRFSTVNLGKLGILIVCGQTDLRT